jgi:glycosyltransferase involved in cell wall biosynthesis
MTKTVPIAVIIATNKDPSLLSDVLARIRNCDPQPEEIWVHFDFVDGGCNNEQHKLPKNVKHLRSSARVGPGGGRHRCLMACNSPYAASFDDDSYPKDPDYFGRAWQLLSDHSCAAIIGANIWNRSEPERSRVKSFIKKPSYVGCGYLIRVEAYRQVRGHLPRGVAYGMEETDLSLQLCEKGWSIYEAGDLRVFHDTELRHHQSPEITAGTITNVALCVFLHYPVIGWGRGVLQVMNKIAYCMRVGRFRGICLGILRIPFDCYEHRQYRKPLPWKTVRHFLKFCRDDLRQFTSSSSKA